jgi:hypothetical protein
MQNMNDKKRIDSTGRPQFVRKSTQAEIDRRDGVITKLYNRGHSSREIAEAIGVGISITSQRILALNLAKGKRVKGAGPVTMDCTWRDEDVPEQAPVPTWAKESRWRQSRVVGMAQMLNDEYTESNFSNVLANQVTDATAAKDDNWQLEALMIFSAAIEKLERARRVLTDESYLVACRDTLEGVEQMRKHHQQQLASAPLKLVQ